MTKSTQHVRECTAAEARERRAQARTFLDVAEMVMSEEPREAHVAAAQMPMIVRRRVLASPASSAASAATSTIIG